MYGAGSSRIAATARATSTDETGEVLPRPSAASARRRRTDCCRAACAHCTPQQKRAFPGLALRSKTAQTHRCAGRAEGRLGGIKRRRNGSRFPPHDASHPRVLILEHFNRLPPDPAACYHLSGRRPPARLAARQAGVFLASRSISTRAPRAIAVTPMQVRAGKRPDAK